MDPKPLTTAEWAEVGTALKFLWLALGFAFVAGPSLLTAHAIIPSVVDTKTVAAKWTKIRAPLYVIGIICVVGIFASLFMASENTDFLQRIYSRWWQ
ncbi:MAG: hypothetical protein ACKVJL_02155 [Dehalococcoidia bacterium]|jgi:hypothetical protein